jgi:hypothetical protein
MRARALVPIAVVLAPLISAVEDMSLVLLPTAYVDRYAAKCLDGSAAGYYLNESATSRSWVFHLEGGGLCIEPVDCRSRMKTSLGSSKFWAPTYQDNEPNVLSPSQLNPFRSWSRVFIKYCSGDTFQGTSNRSDVWHGGVVAGHNILEAVLAHVWDTTSFSHPAMHTVLFSGQSAGGIGVFHNADWMRDWLITKGSNATLRASPQGAIHRAEPHTSGQMRGGLRTRCATRCDDRWVLLPFQRYRLPVLLGALQGSVGPALELGDVRGMVCRHRESSLCQPRVRSGRRLSCEVLEHQHYV